jgi:hypothetical protein
MKYRIGDLAAKGQGKSDRGACSRVFAAWRGDLRHSSRLESATCVNELAAMAEVGSTLSAILLLELPLVLSLAACIARQSIGNLHVLHGTVLSCSCQGGKRVGTPRLKLSVAGLNTNP